MLTLEPRPDSPLRCAACHDLATHALACPGCGAVLHPDCRTELRSCPTLGCRERAAGPGGGKPRHRRRVALGAGLLVVLACGSGLPGTVYRASVLDQWPAFGGRLRPGPGRPELDVAVALQRLTSIPGSADARVVLDGDAYVFSTGWRVVSEGADVVPYPGDPERDLLRISGSDRGRAVAAEYFGVTPDDRLALVRFEYRDGSAGLVNFTCPCHRIGPAPPRRTTAAWKAALGSSDPVERLEALQWLSGAHDEEASCDPEEPIGSDLAAVTALRADPAVFAQIVQLADSQDRWVAESAVEALVSLAGERLDASASARKDRRRDDPAGALATFDGALDVALRPDVLTRIDQDRLAPVVAERARLRLRLGRTQGAIEDLDRCLRLDPTSSPWLRFQLGCARLLHGEREDGLADLRAVQAGPPWPSPYPALWTAVVTGDASPGEPALGDEAWLDAVWSAAVGRSSVEELLLRVDRWAPGRATPSQRRCVLHCFAGAILERLGRPDEALAHYRASVAAKETGWTEHDWASCRLAQHAARGR